MATVRERDPEELIQPIILRIDKEDPSSEDEALSAVARAAVIAYLHDPHHEVWSTWASQAFAKTVRRANPKMFAKVREAYPDAMLSQVGKAQAVGLQPMLAAALPKLIAKLQVSGTQLEPDDTALIGSVNIALNSSLGMSTGKAAAQCAHALFAWLTQAPAPTIESWLQAKAPVGIVRLSAAEFTAAARNAHAPVIHDAGRTEIEPGSATAFVLLKNL